MNLSTETFICWALKKRTPSLDGLQELVLEQLVHVPFENISKLYYKKYSHLHSLSSLELYLDGIERFHFGGTCYTNNFYLYQLLASLGYQIRLYGADMSNPNVHLVSIVTIDGHEYLVDAGYAGPFIAPIPRDLTTDYTILHGTDRYVLKPQDAYGTSRMELYREGILKHGYVVQPAARQIDEFYQVIEDSYRPDATFMNALLLVRFWSNCSLVIHNMTGIQTEGMHSSMHILPNREQLAQTIEEGFGIPRQITREAIEDLKFITDAWS